MPVFGAGWWDLPWNLNHASLLFAGKFEKKKSGQKNTCQAIYLHDDEAKTLIGKKNDNMIDRA